MGIGVTERPERKNVTGLFAPAGSLVLQNSNSTMSKQNVARFDRKGKSEHTKICLSVVHTCTGKGSAQDGLAMEKKKQAFGSFFRRKIISPCHKHPIP
jgi:hypothetical protein